MRYAELTGNLVHHVLPAELANEYEILPPNAVEIALDSDVQEGDVFDNGMFRKPTKNELSAPAMEAFRIARDQIFADTAWIRQRHSDRVELGIDDKENWKAWLSYWQSLREMPLQSDFDPIVPNWPQKPE